jgi:hypothetical protein
MSVRDISDRAHTMARNSAILYRNMKPKADDSPTYAGVLRMIEWTNVLGACLAARGKWQNSRRAAARRKAGRLINLSNHDTPRADLAIPRTS